jgi:membrane protein implicated in regulation of membrane protease activity
VFFPVGIFGRGYTFGSAEDYRRVRRQVNAFILVEMVAIIIAGVVRYSVASPALAYNWPIAFFGLLLFFVVLHFLWMRSLLGRLQSSDERLSLRDLVGPRRP